MSLHLGKTESILFATKHRLNKARDLNIISNGIKIECKTTIKYLGAYIDSNLLGATMAEHSLKKINGSLKFLHRKKQFLSQKDRKMLANALIQPRFDYACTSWFYSLGKTTKIKFQRAQNKVMRFVLSLPPRSSISVEHFSKLGWLNVDYRVKFLGLCSLHKIVYAEQPNYFSDLVKTNTHSYSTRTNTVPVQIPRVQSSGKGTFVYNSAKNWQNLPENLKTIKTQKPFKFKCKNFLKEDMKNTLLSQFVYY